MKILDFLSSTFKVMQEEFEINKVDVYMDKDIDTLYFYLNDSNFTADKNFYSFESKFTEKFEKDFPNHILIFTWKKDPEYLNTSFKKETELLVSYSE